MQFRKIDKKKKWIGKLWKLWKEEDERGRYFDLGNCEIISSCLDCQLINSKIRFERCLMMLEHQECRLFEFIDCHHTDILKITNF